MIIFLQKITQVKNQLNNITKEVEDYIAFLTSDIEDVEEESDKTQRKSSTNKQKDVSQNHLIQAVLKEYFP